MPCSGPNKDLAYAEADTKFAEVLRLLQVRYPTEDESNLWPRLSSDLHRASLNRLKNAVRDVVFSQHCFDF